MTLEKPSPVSHIRPAVLKNSISQDRSYFFTCQSPAWWKENFTLKATCLQAQDTKSLPLHTTPQAHAHMHFECICTFFYIVAYFHKVQNPVTNHFNTDQFQCYQFNAEDIVAQRNIRKIFLKENVRKFIFHHRLMLDYLRCCDIWTNFQGLAYQKSTIQLPQLLTCSRQDPR